MGSATELVRAETAELRSLLDAEMAKRDADAARERDGCVKALEALLVRHDRPDLTLDVHVAVAAGGRATRAGRA